MKKTLTYILCILATSMCSVAQETIFLPYNISPSNLNSSQTLIYKKIINQGLYSSINFIKTNLETLLVDSNGLSFSLPFVPNRNVVYRPNQVQFTDLDNFNWYGKYIASDTTAEIMSGSMTLLSTNGKLIGHMQLDEHSYELYDLTGGIQVICETDMRNFVISDCASRTVNSNKTYNTTANPCENILTKVLVLYTQDAANVEPDITGKANLAISQINSIWNNSGIANSLSIVAIKPLNFTEHLSNLSSYDVNALASNTTAQALRTQYKAEIVILLTSGPYSDSYGVVHDVGGDFADAYGLVSITSATNGRFTFAHEVSHLFGARHDTDPDAGTAHGYPFLTGCWPFRDNRYTLMCILPPSGESRIDHISNPNVQFLGKNTGDWNKNNSQKVNDLKYHVASFFTDPPIGFYAQMTVQDPTSDCGKTATASISTNCGVAPYTYHWYKSLTGTSWTSLSGSSSNISFFIQSTTGGAATNFVKCVVSDAAGHQSTVYGAGHRASCSSGSGHRMANVNQNNIGLVFQDNKNQSFYLNVSNQVMDDIIVNLYDMMGKKIETIFQGIIPIGNKTIEIKTSHLSTGVYLVRAIGENTDINKKIIIQ